MSNGDNKTQWGMILHFSCLAGFVIPMAGLVAPLAIYFIKKDEIPEVAEHGVVVVNWIISYTIYMAIAGVLVLVVVGLILVPLVALLGLVFPIIGGIKASNGEVWKYPGSLPILK